jgi:hypothetical protein
MEPWMPIFKVVNKTVKFSTNGEIDFIDLSETVQQAGADSEIKLALSTFLHQRNRILS